MSFWRHLTRGLRVLTNRTAADQDVDDEVQHYLEQTVEAHVERGLGADEALRAARMEIGHAVVIREQVRDYGWENTVGALLADMRFAGRILRKSPVFTVVVVSVIALGSGAVTTIFSGMNALVLRPLPGVSDASHLVTVDRSRADDTGRQQASYAYYQHLRDRAHTLEAVGAWSKVPLTISAGSDGASVFGNLVSGNFFTVLGVRPAIGRFFAPDEDRTPLTHPVIVVSHEFWKTQLAADSGLVGRSIAVNGRPFTLIGVAPEGFRGIIPPVQTDAWVPLMMQPQLRPRHNFTNASWLWLFGRLRNGVTPDSAKRELVALTAQFSADAGAPAGPEALTSVRVSSLRGLPEDLRGVMLGFMTVLLAAAGLVLLIAGVNVGAMLSARSVARRREMAVRAALGAGRTRLLRQLLTEIVVLFVLGALGGLVFALFATAALERIPLPAGVPVSLELSPDFRVLAFALCIAVTAGLVFGLSPALQGARKDITSALREEPVAGGLRRKIMSRTLIVGQLALSLVLLVAAGLFLRALGQGLHVDPGFDSTGVATVPLEPEAWGYDEPRARVFYRMLRERVQALPGVTAVSYTGNLPLSMRSSVEDITLAGTARVSIHTASVDVDYFSTLRLPLVRGRAFTSADDGRAPKVAVVNEMLARRLWPDGSAIGRTFRFRDDRITVVGIARDAKYATLDEDTPPFAYFPLAQWWQSAQALLVRTVAHPAQLVPEIQEAMRAIDPALPRLKITTLQEANAIVLLPQRVAAIVTGVLGAVGLLLAAVGLYGIVAYSASRRTREIGIRVALGARRSNIIGLMVREGMGLVGIGIVIGLLLAAAGTRFMVAWLFNVSPLDGVTFAGMSLIFIAVAFSASYLPARRAARADPLWALRLE